jgi:glycosyltransferase involved in cell wall biosynthesis
VNRISFGSIKMDTCSEGFHIVLFSAGLYDEQGVWGEKIAALSEAKYLKRVFPGSRIHLMERKDIEKIREMHVDLLISYYTGPGGEWRADEIKQYVEGITLLKIYNHADLLEEFARIEVDGFFTNSMRAAEYLSRYRPTRYIPLAIEDDYGRTEPLEKYEADVVFLGSGGMGNKRPETAEKYLRPATDFNFSIWGSHWDREYWERYYGKESSLNNWHTYWKGPLPLGDISRLYSSAKIVVGYHEDSQREWGMWNNRVFEALGCEALFICDDAMGLKEYFGDAVVITEGGDETRALIRYFLSHPAERRRRGKLGREMVMRRFTYSRWAKDLYAFYCSLAGESQQASMRDITLDSQAMKG